MFNESRVVDENMPDTSMPNPQEQPQKRRRARPRKHQPPTDADANLQGLEESEEIFLAVKEKSDYELAVELRRQGKMTIPENPFEASDKAEIDALLSRNVFRFVRYDHGVHKDLQLFNSRVVRGFKGKESEK